MFFKRNKKEQELFSIITYEEVLAAYLNLKSHYYYDNTMYKLKKDIALFEIEKLEEKLEKLTQNLNSNFFMISNSTYINELLLKITYTSAIKSLNRSNVIPCDFNLGNNMKHEVNLNYYIDMPIELHIISVLWIMKFGFCFTEFENSYGNILHSEFDSEKSKTLFSPYFGKYKEWRDNGIEKILELNEKGKNAFYITLDRGPVRKMRIYNAKKFS